MDDEEKRAVLDEIIGLFALPRIAADEFTLYDYLDRMEEWGLERPARCTARNHLERLVEDGKLEKRKVAIDRRQYMAYRWVGGLIENRDKAEAQ